MSLAKGMVPPASFNNCSSPPMPGWRNAQPVCVASGTTARHFHATLVESLGEPAAQRVLQGARIVALGPVTADAVQRMGLPVAAIAADPSDAAMVAAVLEALA